MTKMNQRIAEDVRIAKKAAKENIIKSKSLPEMTFRRLRRLNWLEEIIKGWYILKAPAVNSDASTLWYSSFWTFLKYFLSENYNKNYCLAPVSSLFLKTEANTIPSQVVVILKNGGGRILQLPFKTSLLFYSDKKRFPKNIENFRGVNIVELSKAITMIPESFYTTYESTAELALLMIKNPGDITRHLLENHQPVKANIIAGAYQFLRKKDFVNQIKQDMSVITSVRPKNPFKGRHSILERKRVFSPAAGRIEILWKKYKNQIQLRPPGIHLPAKENLEDMIKKIDSIYTHDAYNSLSIEGYAVTEKLIKKIAEGGFSPKDNAEDKEQAAAMAAKGYYSAFQQVKSFIKRNYGKNIKNIQFKNQIQNWYKQLFAPHVQSGFIRPSLLTGYRNKPVFIKGSRHIPVNHSCVNDVMEQYLKLLKKEDSPWVQALLGHFMLVFIHPFSDGNGRTARFLMNAVLVLSGWNWTIIRQQEKHSYFKALEKASVHGDIRSFEKFIQQEMKVSRKHLSKK